MIEQCAVLTNPKRHNFANFCWCDPIITPSHGKMQQVKAVVRVHNTTKFTDRLAFNYNKMLMRTIGKEYRLCRNVGTRAVDNSTELESRGVHSLLFGTLALSRFLPADPRTAIL